MRNTESESRKYQHYDEFLFFGVLKQANYKNPNIYTATDDIFRSFYLVRYLFKTSHLSSVFINNYIFSYFISLSLIIVNQINSLWIWPFRCRFSQHSKDFYFVSEDKAWLCQKIESYNIIHKLEWLHRWLFWFFNWRTKRLQHSGFASCHQPHY